MSDRDEFLEKAMYAAQVAVSEFYNGDREKAYALLASAFAREWRPIETAPKDQAVDLWGVHRGSMSAACRFTDCVWDYVDKNGILVQSEWTTRKGTIVDPTHWMPRPAPPQR